MTRSLEEARRMVSAFREQIKASAGQQGNSDDDSGAAASPEELLAEAFASLASVESHCSSARGGGDLGPFKRGQMQRVFEEAAFGLRVGEMSGLVESDSGKWKGRKDSFFLSFFLSFLFFLVLLSFSKSEQPKQPTQLRSLSLIKPRKTKKTNPHRRSHHPADRVKEKRSEEFFLFGFFFCRVLFFPFPRSSSSVGESLIFSFRFSLSLSPPL